MQGAEQLVPDLNYGFTTFDHLPYAIFTIFTALTTEGWTDIVH